MRSRRRRNVGNRVPRVERTSLASTDPEPRARLPSACGRQRMAYTATASDARTARRERSEAARRPMVSGGQLRGSGRSKSRRYDRPTRPSRWDRCGKCGAAGAASMVAGYRRRCDAHACRHRICRQPTAASQPAPIRPALDRSTLRRAATHRKLGARTRLWHNGSSTIDRSVRLRGHGSSMLRSVRRWDIRLDDAPGCLRPSTFR